jgi:hypothetical protein
MFAFCKFACCLCATVVVHACACKQDGHVAHNSCTMQAVTDWGWFLVMGWCVVKLFQMDRTFRLPPHKIAAHIGHADLDFWTGRVHCAQSVCMTCCSTGPAGCTESICVVFTSRAWSCSTAMVAMASLAIELLCRMSAGRIDSSESNASAGVPSPNESQAALAAEQQVVHSEVLSALPMRPAPDDLWGAGAAGSPGSPVAA